jgi:proline dehydrogenase
MSTPFASAAMNQARTVLLWLSRRHSLHRLVTEVAPARRLARRFVAGETRAEALAVAAALKERGIRTTLAFLGEHTTAAAEARAAGAEYIALLRALAAAGLEPNCSLKLTQLGLHIDRALAERQLAAIVATADEVGGFVRIDMENADLVQTTLDIFSRLTGGHEPGTPWRLGVVIQSYLRRSEADVRCLIRAGAPVRLVKGAYAEPPAVAFPRKADVDANYLRLAELLLSPAARAAGVYPAFATHDQAIIDAVRALVRARGIPPDAYEFQLLLGVRRELQVRLARAGLRVRVYVPYGSHWYPYFMRRLAERPANVLFLLRSLLHR